MSSALAMTARDALAPASDAEPGEHLPRYERICGLRGACRVPTASAVPHQTHCMARQRGLHALREIPG
jgi:hypothetical protein